MLLLGVLGVSAVAAAQKNGAAELKQQGDQLAAKDQIKAAEDAYLKALAADPRYRAASSALSALYLRQARFTEAVTLLQRATAADPAFAEGWYNLAYALRKGGRHEESIKAYTTFARLDPTNADPYFGLGLAYKELGRKAEAARSFRQYVKVEKRSDRSGWVQKALSMAEELEASSVRDTPARTAPAAAAARPSAEATSQGRGQAVSAREQGDRLLEINQPEDALEKYREAVAQDPTDQVAYEALAQTLFRLRRYGEAATIFRAAVKRDARFAQGWYNLAYALRKSQKHAEAVAAYLAYIKLDPQRADPYYGLALAYLGLGKKSEARQSFEKYIQLEKRPNNNKWVEQAKQEIARLSRQPSAVEGPSSSSGSGSAKPQPSSEPRVSASSSLDEETRLQRERELLLMGGTVNGGTAERASGKGKAKKGSSREKPLPLIVPTEDQPLAPPSPSQAGEEAAGETGQLTTQGDGLARSGRCDKAMPLYEQAVAVDPFNNRAFDGLAFCAFQLKRFTDGVARLQVALRDNPDYHRAWLYKARLERAAGLNTQAVGSFRRYLGGRTESPDAHFELARTLRDLGMKDQALAAYESYLRLEKRAYVASQKLAAYTEMKQLGGTPPPTSLTMPGEDGRTIPVEDYLRRRTEQAQGESSATRAEVEPETRAEATPARPEPALAAPEKRPLGTLSETPPEPAPKAAASSGTTRTQAAARDQDLSDVALLRAIGEDLSPSASVSAADAATTQMVRSAKSSERALIDLADSEFSRRRFISALGLYLLAVRLKPSSIEPLHKGGMVAMALNLMGTASALFRQALALEPSSKALQHYQQLAEAAARERQLNPKQREALIKAADTALDGGQPQVAESNLDKVLDAAPAPNAFFLRARARLLQDKVQLALDDCGLALALDPNLTSCLRLLGDAKLKLGDRASAVYYYRAFLARTPKGARTAAERAAVEKLLETP